MLIRLAAFVMLGTFAYAQPLKTGTQLPSFEVATMKLNVSGRPVSFLPRVKEGFFSSQNVTLEQLLTFAYGVRTFQLSAREKLPSTRYDVSAKLPPQSAADQVPLMLRRLLEERLDLAVHFQSVDANVYFLVVTKEGPKFRVLDAGESFEPKFRSGGAFTMLNGTMAKWGEALSDLVDRAVLDRTGITGTYMHMLTHDGGRVRADFPDVFSAIQEQLGLKLETGRRPVEMLTVDHVGQSLREN
jgi:uncharacterized protein (TIGR03435 family)